MAWCVLVWKEDGTGGCRPPRDRLRTSFAYPDETARTQYNSTCAVGVGLAVRSISRVAAPGRWGQPGRPQRESSASGQDDSAPVQSAFVSCSSSVACPRGRSAGACQESAREPAPFLAPHLQPHPRPTHRPHVLASGPWMCSSQARARRKHVASHSCVLIAHDEQCVRREPQLSQALIRRVEAAVDGRARRWHQRPAESSKLPAHAPQLGVSSAHGSLNALLDLARTRTWIESLEARRRGCAATLASPRPAPRAMRRHRPRRRRRRSGARASVHWAAGS